MHTPVTTQKNDHVAEIIERNFRSANGQLYVGDMSVRSLAEKYGTPLYVYDRGALDHRWDCLRQALPPEFEIFYSIKANPNQTVLRYFLGHGCGLEVASAGEIHQAVEAGCEPSSMIFAGPGKADAELELAVGCGLGEIHVESLSEAKRISAISRRIGRTSQIALRVNPCDQAQGGAMRMGGKPAPFGIDEEQLDDVLDHVTADPQLDVSGIHLFMGTQILDHTILISQYRKAAEIARRVASRLAKPLRTIDFGGGLGIPYFAHERPLDLTALSSELHSFVHELKRDSLLSQARLIVEPGRFLVGEAGIYVTKVNEIKQSRGRSFVIVDGGMHQHLAASGNLGQTIKRNYPVALLNKLDLVNDETVDVVGPLCTPLDMLARNIPLPTAEAGDLFGVFQSGAYARTASPLGFLSHPAPPEIWVDGSSDSMIRRRGQHTDLLQDQCVLPGRRAGTQAVNAGECGATSAAVNNSLEGSNE
jgi:diaminopimelate decarboxylase